MRWPGFPDWRRGVDFEGEVLHGDVDRVDRAEGQVEGVGRAVGFFWAVVWRCAGHSNGEVVFVHFGGLRRWHGGLGAGSSSGEMESDGESQSEVKSLVW